MLHPEGFVIRCVISRGVMCCVLCLCAVCAVCAAHCCVCVCHCLCHCLCACVCVSASLCLCVPCVCCAVASCVCAVPCRVVCSVWSPIIMVTQPFAHKRHVGAWHQPVAICSTIFLFGSSPVPIFYSIFVYPHTVALVQCILVLGFDIKNKWPHDIDTCQHSFTRAANYSAGSVACAAQFKTTFR